MRKIFLTLILLVTFSGLVASYGEFEDHDSCFESIMCPAPDEVPEEDYQDEVSIDDGSASWNGTIEIENVSYMHNFSEKVTNFRFKTMEGKYNEERVNDTRIIYDGVIRTESLCNEPIFDVEIEKSMKYTINVYGNDTYGVRSCSEHPMKVEYRMTLDTYAEEMKAVVNQTGVEKTFESDDFIGMPRAAPGQEDSFDEEDDENEEEVEPASGGPHQKSGGVVDGAIGIFSSFFGVFTGFF